MHDQTTKARPIHLPNLPERDHALEKTPRQGKPVRMASTDCPFSSDDAWILASALDFDSANEPTLDELAQLDRLDWDTLNWRDLDE